MLKELAMASYIAEQDKLNGLKIKETEDFAVKATEKFNDLFGVVPEYVKAIEPDRCQIRHEGMTFLVIAECFNRDIYLIKECVGCEDHLNGDGCDGLMTRVYDMPSLGGALSNGGGCPTKHEIPEDPPNELEEFRKQLRQLLGV